MVAFFGLGLAMPADAGCSGPLRPGCGMPSANPQSAGVIVKPKIGVNERQMQAMFRQYNAQVSRFPEQYLPYYIVRSPSRSDRQLAHALAKDTRVEYAELNGQASAMEGMSENMKK